MRPGTSGKQVPMRPLGEAANSNDVSGLRPPPHCVRARRTAHPEHQSQQRVPDTRMRPAAQGQGSVGSVKRKYDGERGTSPHVGLHKNLAVMLVDNVLGDTQP